MLEGYSGATRLIPIVGDPIAQVKAPKGLTRAFEAAGHDILVIPVHVAPKDIADFFRTADRIRNIDGIIATIPHKFAALAHAATATDRARLLGSANVLRRTPDGWHGDMVDGLAFAEAIAKAGCRIAGARALLVGAGGAGSAIGLALLEAGAAHLAVHDADAARRDALLKKLDTPYPGRLSAGSPDPAGFDIIANATPSGMRAGDAPPVLLDRLQPCMFAGDVITAPEITPFLAAARAKGCRIETGVDMFDANTVLMRDFFTRPL